MQNRLKLFRGCLAAVVLIFLPFVTFGQTSNVQPRITAAVNESQLTTLRGNTHPYAQAQFDRGAAPDSLPMERMLLVLTRSAAQETALDTLMEQQQDASSPNYHAWLTPQQFGQQFGPADADIQTITLWLQSHGFTVNRVSNGRTVIEFSGTAGQVRDAFHTQIHRYNVNNEDHWANSSDPQIPTALTPVVAGVDTLHNFPREPMYHMGGPVTRSKETGKLQSSEPLFTFSNSQCGVPGLACYGVGPYDFATIYNVLPLWNATTPIDGTGETIAIVGESDINIQDVRDFRNYFGLPPNDPKFILDGPDPGTVQGDETESDLDVEWSGAVAKGATIDFVISQTTEASLGVDLSAQYVVDNNLAPILSESYGICELGLGTAGNQFYDQLWQQAAAQGITVLVSSGDSGSAGCDPHGAQPPSPAQFGLMVSGFESTPYNVSVGGTDFNDLTNPAPYWSTTNSPPPGNPTLPATVSALSYIPETTWNATCTNAVFGTLGYSTNAETNCNDSRLVDEVWTLGGAGGASGCTTSNGQTTSSCSGGYAKPSWQTGTGVPNDKVRDVPDVSLFSAINGPSGAFYLICAADLVQPGATSCQTTDPNTEFISVGGTSASAPAFAGIMALVDQKMGSGQGNAGQGNANYVLYQLAAKSGNSCTSAANPASTCVFYDVTNGTNAMPCAKGSPNCTTSNPGDAYGVLSGYNTTAGYDLATGLGSVNANNLVAAWKNAGVALKSSSTTLTLTPPNGVTLSTLVHGQSVGVNIGVTGTPGTPTGNVSLIANTAPPSAPSGVSQQGVQAFPLVNGSASQNTSALPGGSYTVVAQYPGDGTFGSSSSTPPVSVIVGAEPSKTFANLLTFDINGNPIAFGASSATYGSGYYLLRIDVGNAAASVSSTGVSSTCSQGVTNCPTGTVTATSTGSQLPTGSLALNIQGYAEIQSLGVGNYPVTVSYPGDPSYGASTATLNFTIAKGPTTASAGVAGLPVEYGNSEEVAAAVLTTSDGAAPTGTISFFLDGSPLTTTPLVYEGFPYPSGQPPSYANLNATASAIFLSQGSHTLTVQYSGDGNYAGSTSPPATITVMKAQPFFLGFGANPASTNINQQVTLTATMAGSDAGVPPTGTMTFSDGGTPVSGTVTYTPVSATPTTVSELMATMPYTPTTAGTHNITVSYSGDGNYLSASTPGSAPLTVTGPTFTVTANPTTIPVTAPGQSGSTTLTFTGQNGFSSGGAVTVTPVCTGLPSETSCSSGVSITIPTNGTATAMVMFLTSAPSAVVPASRNRPDIGGWRLAAGMLALACLLCASMLAFGYRERRRWGFALMFAVFALLAVSVGCGGGGGGGSTGPTNPGTPVGDYSGVSVSVTINGVTQTIPGLTLNVQ